MLYITNQPLTDTHIPGFLRMAEREAAPPWAKSRSCMTRRCRSSNSCLNSLASAAISAGSVGICESSMSLRTCCRSWGGNMLMKVAGSVSTPWLPCCCCWIRCCSTRCCWSTCCMTFHKRMSAPMYRNKGNVSWINRQSTSKCNQPYAHPRTHLNTVWCTLWILQAAQQTAWTFMGLIKPLLPPSPRSHRQKENTETPLSSCFTSSWMLGGKAARNSGLTSMAPGVSADCCCCCCALCWSRCKRICSAITSWRMFSGRAARNDGSTPSGKSSGTYEVLGHGGSSSLKVSYKHCQRRVCAVLCCAVCVCVCVHACVCFLFPAKMHHCTISHSCIWTCGNHYQWSLS